MKEEKEEKKSWGTTLPGILVGLAAVITAIGGCIAVIIASPKIMDTIFPSTPTPVISLLTSPPPTEKFASTESPGDSEIIIATSSNTALMENPTKVLPTEAKPTQTEIPKAPSIVTDDIIWQYVNGQVHYWPIKKGQLGEGINIGVPIGSEWSIKGVGNVDE